MIKTNKGFTFVELLVVITIIGVLAGLLYLMMGPSGDMAKKKACFGNRTTIMLALETYRYAEGKSKTSYSLQDFIDAKYEDTMSTENAKCPSGGVYSAGEENGREVVLCSVHYPTPGGGDESGGGGELDPPGNIIPGTDIFGGDGVQALEKWEDQPIRVETWPDGSNAYISIEKGKKFYFDNPDGSRTFYLGLVDDPNVMFNSNNKDKQGNIITTPDNLPDWVYQNATGILPFTGVSEKWDNVNTGDIFKRGDILYYNGDYYVCFTQSYTIHKDKDWSNTPDINGGEWYKLSN